MLKIKDNVDLKELEKFGFNDEGFWYRIEIFEDTDIVAIGINKETRLIQIAYSTRGSSCGYTYSLDRLFDLISAGLVEKVADK